MDTKDSVKRSERKYTAPLNPAVQARLGDRPHMDRSKHIQLGGGSVSSIFLALSLMMKELVMFVAYVKNNAFPQPLPEAEEEKYLRLMATGDPEARNKLIEHNLRLVAHIVKKFENTGEDSEDLISIGTIGLIKAIESYQVDKGTKLATYAARCIENESSLTNAPVCRQTDGCLCAYNGVPFR